MLLFMRVKGHSIVGTNHTLMKNWSAADIVLEKVHAQKKIFYIKRDFLHKRAAQCYFLCVQKVIQL